MSADLERTGDLARHIAKIARLRCPDSAIPEDLRETIAHMGEIGIQPAARLAETIERKNVADRLIFLATGDD